MKKYIFYIVLFFAAVVAVDLIYGRVANYMVTHAKGGETKKLVDLCENDHYDMLIMGSSKAHHNYIPQVFRDSLGMSCYNAGYDGNGIILAYGILSLIDDERLPKVIVYDAKQQFDIYQYSGDGDHTRYYQKLKTFYGNPAVDEVIGNISEYDVLKLHSSLYRTNGNLVSMLLGFLRDSPKDKNYGYIPAIGFLTEDNEQEKDYTDNIDSLKIEYFKRFVELTKERNIELIAVFSPEYNTPFADDFKPIREICSKEGVAVLDYFEDPSFQKIELFKDHCHLNEDGAKLFSEMIVADIQKINH